MGKGRDARRKRKRAKLVAQIRELELRDALRRQELADTDAALAEARGRLDRERGDGRPLWERIADVEGGCPL